MTAWEADAKVKKGSSDVGAQASSDPAPAITHLHLHNPGRLLTPSPHSPSSPQWLGDLRAPATGPSLPSLPTALPGSHLPPSGLNAQVAPVLLRPTRPCAACPARPAPSASAWPGLVLPQGLCTCCALWHTVPQHGSSLASFGSLLLKTAAPSLTRASAPRSPQLCPSQPYTQRPWAGLSHGEPPTCPHDFLSELEGA